MIKFLTTYLLTNGKALFILVYYSCNRDIAVMIVVFFDVFFSVFVVFIPGENFMVIFLRGKSPHAA